MAEVNWQKARAFHERFKRVTSLPLTGDAAGKFQQDVEMKPGRAQER